MSELNHRDVLIAPVVSEKSYGMLDENKYTFLVATDANKTEIKIAVEKIFGVRVLSVNTLNRPGKRKRTRVGFGKRNDTKRADRKSTRLNSSHSQQSRMPSSA